MAERPGFMIYFDIAPALFKLTDDEAGKLFKAIMDYATSGTVHDLGGICEFAFDVIRPRIDRDRAAYEEKCRKNSYTAYVREAKRKGNSFLSYDEWLTHETNVHEREQSLPNVHERDQLQLQQQLNSNTTTTTTTTTTENNIGAAAVSNPVAAVISDYRNRINQTPSQTCLDELAGYVEEMGEAVCKRAFDIALDSKKAMWPYIRGILRSKQQQGVKCLEDWDALEEKRDMARRKDDSDGNTREDHGETERIGNYV